MCLLGMQHHSYLEHLKRLKLYSLRRYLIKIIKKTSDLYTVLSLTIYPLLIISTLLTVYSLILAHALPAISISFNLKDSGYSILLHTMISQKSSMKSLINCFFQTVWLMIFEVNFNLGFKPS